MTATADVAAGGRLGHRPALDGIRGLAVVAVLLFHHGIGWAGGGFLGVSAFFTLSGFLITSIVLAEVGGPGRLRRFWSRRARRLLPAAWLTLAFVFGLAAAGAVPGPSSADALAALANVANWQQIASERSYADLLTAPGALVHFWSLAIEEQFYLAFPLVMLAATARWSTRRLAGWAVAGALASTATMAALGAGDRAYYGTDTRAAELLVGVAGALVVFGPRFRAGPRLRRAVRATGPIALVGVALMWVTAEVGSAWLYRGGFLLHATLTLLVVGAALAGGPVTAVLGFGPLAALGRVSYGVYLYHWPVFLWIDGGSGPSLLARRLAVTLVLAVGSYVLVERPILDRRALAGSARRVGAVAAGGAVALVAVAAWSPGEGSRVDVLAEARATISGDPAAAAAAAGEEADAIAGLDLGGPSTPASRAGDPVDALVIGDSTALFVGGGLNFFAQNHPDRMGRVVTESWFACTLIRGSEITYRVGAPTLGAEECQRRDEHWPVTIGSASPDVVVAVLGPHDVGDHRFGSSRPSHVGQTALDAVLRAEMVEATRLVTETGVPLIWLSAPHIEVGRDAVPPVDEPASDDRRMDRFNELLRSVVAELRADDVSVDLVDLNAFIDTTAGGRENAELQPDGVHFTLGSAAILANSWLGPEVVAAAQELIGP